MKLYDREPLLRARVRRAALVAGVLAAYIVATALSAGTTWAETRHPTQRTSPPLPDCTAVVDRAVTDRLELAWSRTRAGDRVAGGGEFRRVVDSLVGRAAAGDRSATTALAWVSLSPRVPLDDREMLVVLGTGRPDWSSFGLVAYARGRLAERLGDTARARDAYDLAASDQCWAPPALLGMARMLAVEGADHSAVRAYWSAVESATATAEWRAIHADIETVSPPPDSGEARQGARGRDVVELRAFWDRLGLPSGWTGRERLLEHLRRRGQARSRFAMPATARAHRLSVRAFLIESDADFSFGPPAVADPPRANERIRRAPEADPWVDDRGVMYVRHGEPHLIVRYPGVSGAEAESWLYDLGRQRLVLHFSGVVGDAVAQPTTLVALPPGDLMSACRLNARFCVLEAHRSMGRDVRYEYSKMLEQGRTDAARARSSSTWARTYARELGMTVQAYGLLDSAGHSALAIVVAIPAREVRSVGDSGDATDIGLRLVGRSATPGMPEVVDSLTLRMPRADLADGGQVAGVLQIRAPAGEYSLAVVGEAGGAGGVVLVDSVPVPARGGDALMAGSLVLGSTASGIRWRGPDTVTSFNPLNAFDARTPVALWSHLSGLVPGHSYQFAVRVTEHDGTSQLVIRGQRVATREVETLLITLDIGTLRPGTHLAEFEIRGGSSERRLTRRQVLNVTD